MVSVPLSRNMTHPVLLCLVQILGTPNSVFVSLSRYLAHPALILPLCQVPGPSCPTRPAFSRGSSREEMQPHHKQVYSKHAKGKSNNATKLSRARRLSCALVAGVDEGVGLLKERLAKAGALEDTVCHRSSPKGCFKATCCPSGDSVLLGQWRGALRRCS